MSERSPSLNMGNQTPERANRDTGPANHARVEVSVDAALSHHDGSLLACISRTLFCCRWIPASLCALMILILSNRPVPKPRDLGVPWLEYNSYLAHIGAYALLAIFVAWALIGTLPAFPKWSLVVWTGTACTLFGIAIEFEQPLFGRSCTFFDMVSNGIGAWGGAAVFCVGFYICLDAIPPLLGRRSGWASPRP